MAPRCWLSDAHHLQEQAIKSLRPTQGSKPVFSVTSWLVSYISAKASVI